MLSRVAVLFVTVIATLTGGVGHAASIYGTEAAGWVSSDGIGFPNYEDGNPALCVACIFGPFGYPTPPYTVNPDFFTKPPQPLASGSYIHVDPVTGATSTASSKAQLSDGTLTASVTASEGLEAASRAVLADSLHIEKWPTNGVVQFTFTVSGTASTSQMENAVGIIEVYNSTILPGGPSVAYGLPIGVGDINLDLSTDMGTQTVTIQAPNLNPSYLGNGNLLFCGSMGCYGDLTFAAVLVAVADTPDGYQTSNFTNLSGAISISLPPGSSATSASGVLPIGPMSAVSPEPTTLLTMALGIGILLLGRRKFLETPNSLSAARNTT